MSPADVSPLPVRLGQQEVQKEIGGLEAETGLAVFLTALPQAFHFRNSHEDAIPAPILLPKPALGFSVYLPWVCKPAPEGRGGSGPISTFPLFP